MLAGFEEPVEVLGICFLFGKYWFQTSDLRPAIMKEDSVICFSPSEEMPSNA
jgi:hypothetical protein